MGLDVEGETGMSKARIAVVALTLSTAALAGWFASEGDGPIVTIDGVEHHAPYIPVKGDVPTIGHGSTRYEDGTPVKLTDPPIPRSRAQELAINLHSVEERRFKASLPGVELTQGEYDLYVDFVGQYGISNWRVSSMRRHLLSGEYTQACHALLNWKKVNGYDCSTLVNGKPNKVCWGVWERQMARHAKCMKEQS
jgi:GH24 family phage-related lysozyme (muramidase)